LARDILAAVYRKLTWKALLSRCDEGARWLGLAMMLMIIVGSPHSRNSSPFPRVDRLIFLRHEFRFGFLCDFWR